MRTLLLTALLLAAPAAPAQTAPAATGTAAVTLRLTAPVGATAQLRTGTTTRLTLEDVQATAPGGRKASAAELAELRSQLEQGFRAASAQAVTGRATYRVQSRAANGTVTLLSTVTTNVPGQGALNIRLTQTVAPNGQTRITRVESDNPQVQAALRGLSQEVLRAQVNSGGNPLGLYGQAFTRGQARTQTTTVDAQALLGGVLAAVAGGAPGNLQADPLSVRTTTTYRGTNATGQRVFETGGTIGRWSAELNIQGASGGRLRMELLSGTQGGQSVYRPDGLPVSQTMNQTLRMRLSITQPDGSQVQMVMRLVQAVTLRAP